MEITIRIEGMMCPHCSGRVQKALEALPQVERAVVSHESGTAIVTAKEATEDALRDACVAAITDAGYQVVG